MHVSIRAVNADHNTGPLSMEGKRTTVDARSFQLEATAEGVRIWAQDQEDYGTGGRGGEVKRIARHLFVLLEPSDLQRIFDAAIKAKVLQVPGLQRLVEARAQMEEVIVELGGGER